ncbi:U32 family peptidase [Paenibacillus rhizoplanae]
MHDLNEVDSLKIEGRMKAPTYVANVVSKYRMALDHKITEEDKENLKKHSIEHLLKGICFTKIREILQTS